MITPLAPSPGIQPYFPSSDDCTLYPPILFLTRGRERSCGSKPPTFSFCIRWWDAVPPLPSFPPVQCRPSPVHLRTAPVFPTFPTTPLFVEGASGFFFFSSPRCVFFSSVRVIKRGVFCFFPLVRFRLFSREFHGLFGATPRLTRTYVPD